MCASSFRTECSADLCDADLWCFHSNDVCKQQVWRPWYTHCKHAAQDLANLSPNSNDGWSACRTETCGRRSPPTAALSTSALTLGGAGRNEVVICGPPSLRKTHPRGNHGTLARPRQTSKIYAQEHSASIPFAPVCHPVRLQVCLPVAHGRYTQEHLQGKCSRMAPVHYHQGADG